MPGLAAAREHEIVVVCRSGNRSALAAHAMQRLGFARVRSLKTGLRGWNDFEQPLIDAHGRPVRLDAADEYFTPEVTAEQRGPGEP